MKIARSLLDQMVDHARRVYPEECCGAAAVRDDRIVEVYELENVAHSPYRFETGIDLLGPMEAIEDAGAQFALYHSHPRTEAAPSQTDMNLSDAYPGALWIIVGHVQTEPEVRCFNVTPETVAEVALEVE